MGLDELEIRDLDQVTQVYASLLSAHARLLHVMLPLVHWKNVKVVLVFEQNTYRCSLQDVKALVQNELCNSGVQLEFYHKFSSRSSKPLLGKHVCKKVKLEMVLSCVDYITKKRLLYCDMVMSLGWAVLAGATSKVNHLWTGPCRTSVSSKVLGSADMDVSMYRNSKQGLNTSNRFIVDFLDTPGQLMLSNEKLTDAQHAVYGQELLTKLRSEMELVTIQDSDHGGGANVKTGGKKSVRSAYTRDDLLCAMLLLCHSCDEMKDWSKNSHIRTVI